MFNITYNTWNKLSLKTFRLCYCSKHYTNHLSFIFKIGRRFLSFIKILYILYINLKAYINIVGYDLYNFKIIIIIMYIYDS